MSSAEAALRRCWRGLAGGEHESTIDDIVARHREPHRHYHTADHVMWVLRHVDDLLRAAPAGVDDIDGDAVRAAGLLHDVIYDPRSPTNEHDSAVLATRSLRQLGWAGDRIARVGTLIEATAGHDVDGLDGAVLLDADLAILGSPPARYRAYVAQVRAEYDHLDADAWRTGRATVLQSFLDRPAIYATATMHDARERRARANLSAEISELAAGVPR